ncbi:Transposase [Staphylococcus epidermidis]|nr:Transposase [Staphylococcus epidermidis]
MIVSYLDKEIEDLNQHINNEGCTKIRKEIRFRQNKIKNTKSKLKITLSEKINTKHKNLF